jgi:hypothetical protein
MTTSTVTAFTSPCAHDGQKPRDVDRDILYRPPQWG